MTPPSHSPLAGRVPAPWRSRRLERSAETWPAAAGPGKREEINGDCNEGPSEARILECLWFGLTQTDIGAAEDFAEMAMDVYTGRRTSNLLDFAVRLGQVITHLFGVTAPEPPAIIPAPRGVACSEAMVGQGGMRA